MSKKYIATRDVVVRTEPTEKSHAVGMIVEGCEVKINKAFENGINTWAEVVGPRRQKCFIPTNAIRIEDTTPKKHIEEIVHGNKKQ